MNRCDESWDWLPYHKQGLLLIQSTEESKISLGPISLAIFPSQFEWDGNYNLLSSKLCQSDCYKIMHIARQLCCCSMYKILLRYDYQ